MKYLGMFGFLILLFVGTVWFINEETDRAMRPERRATLEAQARDSIDASISAMQTSKARIPSGK